jgi:hypothetical protein
MLQVCLLPENSSRNALSFIGETITTEYRDKSPVSFVVDAVRAERVQFCLDYIDKQCDDHSVRYLSEKAVNPKFLVGRDDLGGTIDVLLISQLLEVIDLKDGFGLVEPDCPQLEQYAFGAIDHLRSTGGPLIGTIRLTILQPKRRGIAGHTGVMSVDIPYEEFMGRKGALIRDAVATDNPKAPLIPGDEQCKWCPHKINCPEVGKMVKQSTGMDMDAVTLLMDAANSTPSQKTNEELSRMCEAAPQIRQLLVAIEEEAQRRMLAGQSIAGFKLVQGVGNSAWWTNDDTMVEEMLIKMGVPKESTHTQKLLSPTQAKALVWVKKKRASGGVPGESISVSLSPQQKGTLDSQYIVRPKGKVTMVPESDSRSSISLNAAELFSQVVVTPEPSLPDFNLKAFLAGFNGGFTNG